MGGRAGTPDLVYLTGETGVGGGVMVDGRLLRGAEGFSGEIGHMPLNPGGDLCGCGRRGCWETMVGLAALLRMAATPDDPVCDPSLDLEQRLAVLSGRADDGDPRTLEALELVGDALGLGASILVNVFNPRVLVLGGYFASLGALPARPRCCRELRATGHRAGRVRGRAVHARFRRGRRGAARTSRWRRCSTTRRWSPCDIGPEGRGAGRATPHTTAGAPHGRKEGPRRSAPVGEATPVTPHPACRAPLGRLVDVPDEQGDRGDRSRGHAGWLDCADRWRWRPRPPRWPPAWPRRRPPWPRRPPADAPFKALVFSKTTGFRHDSIPDGIAAIQKLGQEHDFAVDATEDSALFTDANLAQYNVVIFMSTTGDPLGAPSEKDAFQRYIQHGGGYVGVHAAADTELRLGVVRRAGRRVLQAAPRDPAGDRQGRGPGAPVDRRACRPRWSRTDEWYDYQTNPRGTVHVLTSLDETTYTGGTHGLRPPEHLVPGLRRRPLLVHRPRPHQGELRRAELPARCCSAASRPRRAWCRRTARPRRTRASRRSPSTTTRRTR